MRAIRFGYRVDEAAKLIGVSRETIYKAIKNGEIRTVRLNSRIIVPHVALVELFGDPSSSDPLEVA